MRTNHTAKLFTMRLTSEDATNLETVVRLEGDFAGTDTGAFAYRFEVNATSVLRRYLADRARDLRAVEIEQESSKARKGKRR